MAESKSQHRSARKVYLLKVGKEFSSQFEVGYYSSREEVLTVIKKHLVGEVKSEPYLDYMDTTKYTGIDPAPVFYVKRVVLGVTDLATIESCKPVKRG